MEKKKVKKWLLLSVSHITVAAIATVMTLSTGGSRQNSKLDEIHRLIENRYIGEYSETDLYDGAAAGMISGTGSPVSL